MVPSNPFKEDWGHDQSAKPTCIWRFSSRIPPRSPRHRRFGAEFGGSGPPNGGLGACRKGSGDRTGTGSRTRDPCLAAGWDPWEATDPCRALSQPGASSTSGVSRTYRHSWGRRGTFLSHQGPSTGAGHRLQPAPAQHPANSRGKNSRRIPQMCPTRYCLYSIHLPPQTGQQRAQSTLSP